MEGGDYAAEGRVYSRVGNEPQDDGRAEGWNMPQMPAKAELLKQQLWTTVNANTKYERRQGWRAGNGSVYCQSKSDPQYGEAEGSKITTNPSKADWLCQKFLIGGNTNTPLKWEQGIIGGRGRVCSQGESMHCDEGQGNDILTAKRAKKVPASHVKTREQTRKAEHQQFQ